MTSVTGGTAAVIGVSAATAPTVVLTPFFSGIALDVTPQIDEYNNIILHIHPAVSEVVQRNKAFIVGSDSFNLPLASSTIQESDNIVRAFNGQIVVIGGLMKEGATDQDAGIPLLADIPILGNAFKHKRVTRIKRELVIMLKPRWWTLPRCGRAPSRIRRDASRSSSADMAIFPGAVKVHCANNGAWIGVMDFVQACFP